MKIKGLMTAEQYRQLENVGPKVPPAVQRARDRAVQARTHGPLNSNRWYRIRNEAVDVDGDGAPEILIYGYIGDNWLPEDVTAYSFVQDLAAINAPEISVRINSPGGYVHDGIVIYNALKDHPSRINVTVDGLAASAASFVAMAGDTVTMNRAAELMIHDAWGLAIGNAADMRDMAEFLDRQSDKVAGIYAARAGGAVADWRAAMETETWYSATEAVDAGLADRAVQADVAVPDPGEKADDEQPTAAALFTYPGRAGAPAPAMPSKMSTDAPPDGAPDSSAAEAVERQAAARQRRHTVAQGEIRRISAQLRARKVTT